jgi:CRISPR-associated protein Csx14
MAKVLLATLGQAPQAITFALDKLMAEGNQYDLLGVLHTDVERSAIKDAYHNLMQYLSHSYTNLHVVSHVLTHNNGTPLVDVEDETSARAYFRSLGNILWAYKKERYHVHLMVSGGRKAMSIYATIAASLVFIPPHDRIYTVLSPESALAKSWRVDPKDWHKVQMVSLPFAPYRRVPNQDLEALFALEEFPNPHTQFLHSLTPEELKLAQTLAQNPYESNGQLARRLQKSEATVNNQFTSIYERMSAYYGLAADFSNQAKRIALLDIMREGE